MSLAIVPRTASIGAEVHGIDLAGPIDAGQRKELQDALAEHIVLVFPDQPLTVDQQMAFASLFGELEVHPFAKHHPDHPELILLDETEPPRGDAGYCFHADATFLERPSLGVVLRAVELPPTGGDTCWASMYAAYEALSAPMRSMLDELTALHDLSYTANKVIAHGRAARDEMATLQAQWPPVEHPVVRTHPVTGRRALYVNENFTSRILGITERESDRLLPFLLEHVRRPDFQFRHRWSRDDVVLWDNRCSVHYAVPDYHQRRLMHRVTIAGDERPT